MVVYYSLDGHTRVYAEVLAELLNEAPVELLEKRPRSGGIGKLSAVIDAVLGIPSELAQIPGVPAGKPVFICSPIWAGGLVPAVTAFIKKAALGHGKVNVVLTCNNILNRDSYIKKVTKQLKSGGLAPGFVQVFVGPGTDKRPPDRATVRKHLKKLVLNVDETF